MHLSILIEIRKSGRVVEGNGLENRRTRKGTVSSNLTSSVFAGRGIACPPLAEATAVSVSFALTFTTPIDYKFVAPRF